MLYVKDKQYILDNFETLQFDCDCKVKLVRDYLSNECGFNPGSWSLENFLDLKWLNISDPIYKMNIAGNYEARSDLTKCNIDYLLGLVKADINLCKPINLKD